MRQITARFNSRCAETGHPLRKGQQIYYDGRNAYHPSSDAVRNWLRREERRHEMCHEASYIQAQERAYWDRLTGNYYSQ